MADAELTATLAAIQQTLAALGARVAALEAAVAGAASAPVEPTGAPEVASSQPAPPPVEERAIAPEILLVISAAVAAYLGERAHVKQVRLIGSQEWGRQGRVNVQASHALHR